MKPKQKASLPSLSRLCSLTTPAFALTLATEPSAATDDSTNGSTGDSAGLLAGPKVQTQDEGAGLSAMTFSGEMQRPDAPVAELALQTLELDAQTQTKIDAILLEPGRGDRRLCDEQPRDPRRAQGRAGRTEIPPGRERRERRKIPWQPANREAANNEPSNGGGPLRPIMEKITEQLGPHLKEGRLEDRIAAVLPVTQREAFTASIEQYRTQVAQARGSAKSPAGKPAGKPAADPLQPPPGARSQRNLEEIREIVTIEIPRSYQRILDQRGNNLDELSAALDLDDATDQAVRRIFREAAAEAGDASKIDRRKLLQELREVLTPEQLRKLRQHSHGQRG